MTKLIDRLNETAFNSANYDDLCEILENNYYPYALDGRWYKIHLVKNSSNKYEIADDSDSFIGNVHFVISGTDLDVLNLSSNPVSDSRNYRIIDSKLVKCVASSSLGASNRPSYIPEIKLIGSLTKNLVTGVGLPFLTEDKIREITLLVYIVEGSLF